MNMLTLQPVAPVVPPYMQKRGMSGGQIAALICGILLVMGLAAGILVYAGAKKLSNVVESGQERRVEADLSMYKIALSLYRNDAGTFPSNEQGLLALVEKPTTGKVAKKWEPYLREETRDPWGNHYQYLWPPIRNRSQPDIYSLGPDGKDGTGDEIGNWD